MFMLLICVVGFDCEQPTVELLVFLQRAAKIRDPPTQGYPTYDTNNNRSEHGIKVITSMTAQFYHS